MLKTKSLLPYPAYRQALKLKWYRAGMLYKREEFPLFGKEGLGKIFGRICLFNYGLLSNQY